MAGAAAGSRPYLDMRGSPAILTLLLWIVPASADTLPDIEYARIGETSLKLDLHRPAESNPPLLVYVHGGAWRAGSRKDVPVLPLLEKGFAIASVDYRLSTEARFPAQIHDIKAAIRFLRAKATELGVDAGRIGIVGTSAGGHLAALAGVSAGVEELEGEVGESRGLSSRVDVIVSYYGASNLESILSQSTEFGLGVRVPALKLLLGDLPENKPALARLASPVAHLDASDPPVLLLHGDADPQMPFAQSAEFLEACRVAGVAARLVSLPGSVHGGEEFFTGPPLETVAAFLREKLSNP